MSLVKEEEEGILSFSGFLTETPVTATITQVVLTENNFLETSLLGPLR